MSVLTSTAAARGATTARRPLQRLPIGATVAGGAAALALLFFAQFEAWLPNDAMVAMGVPGSPLPVLTALTLVAEGVACAVLISRSSHPDFGVLVMHYGQRCAAAGACIAGVGLLIYVLWMGALFPVWHVDVAVAEAAVAAVLVGGAVFCAALPAVGSALLTPWVSRPGD